MQTGNKRAVSVLISVILMVAMLVAIAAVANLWIGRMQTNIQDQASTQVASVTTSMMPNVRILSLNSTKDGLIIENRGENNITTVTVLVNGEVTAMNLNLTDKIPPRSFGLIPLNSSAAGEPEVDIQLLATDSQSTTYTALKTFFFNEAYNVLVENTTCYPCNQAPAGCNVTIVDINQPYNGTAFCSVNQSADPFDCYTYANIPVTGNVSASSCEAECGPSPNCAPF